MLHMCIGIPRKLIELHCNEIKSVDSSKLKKSERTHNLDKFGEYLKNTFKVAIPYINSEYDVNSFSGVESLFIMENASLELFSYLDEFETVQEKESDTPVKKRSEKILQIWKDFFSIIKAVRNY